MDHSLFAKFAPLLRHMTEREMMAEIEQPKRLLLETDLVGGRRVEIAYAPFDHVNHEADIVIVGLTPGRQQMRNALLEARRALRNEEDEQHAASAAKVFASFSGPMRSNLVAMLDSIGMQRALGLTSTASLWKGDAFRVHFTSALRYPTFVEDANFSGVPSVLSTPMLRAHLMRWFAAEMTALPKAIYVPLGPRVAEAVEEAAQHIGLDRGRVLSGMPHPSGANGERIAFFLGRKPREILSRQVDPDRLIAARTTIEAKIAGVL